MRIEEQLDVLQSAMGAALQLKKAQICLSQALHALTAVQPGLEHHGDHPCCCEPFCVPCGVCQRRLVRGAVAKIRVELGMDPED